MDQVFDLPAAIMDGVLDLRADLGERLAFPRHLAGRDMPFRVARHAAGLEVGFLVTDRTTHRLCTMTVNAAFDGRLVQPALVTLARADARPIAFKTTRLGTHPAEVRGHSPRPRRRRRDRSTNFRRRHRLSRA